MIDVKHGIKKLDCVRAVIQVSEIQSMEFVQDFLLQIKILKKVKFKLILGMLMTIVQYMDMSMLKINGTQNGLMVVKKSVKNAILAII